MWLTSMTQHICETCGSSSIRGTPTILYEDNVICIAQLIEMYIKWDKTKHISLKFFFKHEIDKYGDICYYPIFDLLIFTFWKKQKYIKKNKNSKISWYSGKIEGNWEFDSQLRIKLHESKTKNQSGKSV